MEQGDDVLKGELLLLDLEEVEYLEALHKQEELFEDVLEAKMHNRMAALENRINPIHYLLLCEHPPVYTLGKSGKRENLKIDPESIDAEFFHTNRGGDITFHGPGQLVVYPILDLEAYGMSLKDYVEALEQVVIDVLLVYKIEAGRLEGASGVWVRPGSPDAKKICAIGIKASRYVTMHGIALNVSTDLSFFDHIIPCGIEDKGVTSMEKELGKELDMEEVKGWFLKIFANHFTGL